MTSRTSAIASLDSIMPPSTHCSAAMSCGGVRSKSSRGASSATLTRLHPLAVQACGDRGPAGPAGSAGPGHPRGPLSRLRPAPFYRMVLTVFCERLARVQSGCAQDCAQPGAHGTAHECAALTENASTEAEACHTGVM